MTSRRTLALAAVMGFTTCTATQALAQDYPVRPIRVVVPFAPGGGTDILARLIGQRWHESMGQPVIVENRAGASGNIGAELVAKSAPDGYTLMLSTASLTVNHTLYPKLAYDLRRDFAPISQVASSAIVLVTHPSVPVRTVKELAALSQKTKGGLNFASNGAGTTSHLSGVLLQQMARVAVNHIHYKGAAPAIVATVGGEVELAFPAVISARPHVLAGRLRGLAVTTVKRSPVLPELPTLDSMYPGFETYNWFTFFAPAKTPQAIITRLHGEVVKALQHPDVKAFMERDGAEPVGNSPAEIAAFINREIDKYAKIIRSAGVKLD